MNTPLRIAAAIAALLVTSAVADARPRHHHYKATHHRTIHKLPIGELGCVWTNEGRTICSGFSQSTPRQSRTHAVYDANSNEATYSYRGMRVTNRVSIPTPSGSRRVSRSCGERLALYWGLGGGLDGSWTWANRFERASAPGPRVAVVMPGHVMGVIGGGPGAWRVVSFNGDRHHGNVEFTVNRLNGILVDTTRPRVARR